MKRILRSFMVIVVIVSISSQGQTRPNGNEGLNDSDKDISRCFEKLMRELRQIDSSCNSLSNTTGDLENGVAAVESVTGSLDTNNGYVDQTLMNLKSLVATLEREQDRFNRRAAVIEVRNPTIKKELQECAARALSLETAMDKVQGQILDLEIPIGAYQLFFDYVTVDPDDINGLRGPHVIFTGANVHVQRGVINDNSGSGSGNLIIGYNEDSFGKSRTGSHNVIVGPEHGYSSDGGFVAGLGNTVSGRYASVSGGMDNHASGYASSIRGASWLETVDAYSYGPESDRTAGNH